MSFETLAEKKNVKLHIALVGGPGGGKTYTALLMATLLGAKKIAVIDSENGRSEKYAGKFKFAIEKPLEFKLRTYLELIAAAKKAGVDVLIIDSFSHLWNGKGGALEQVDSMGGNKFSNGWKTVTPLYNDVIQAILTYPGHVICTMRTKVEYVVEQNDQGKAVPRKLGLKPIQREDVEYEFDFVFNMGNDGSVTCQKQQGVDELEGFVGRRADVPEIVQKMMTLVG